MRISYSYNRQKNSNLHHTAASRCYLFSLHAGSQCSQGMECGRRRTHPKQARLSLLYALAVVPRGFSRVVEEVSVEIGEVGEADFIANV